MARFNTPPPHTHPSLLKACIGRTWTENTLKSPILFRVIPPACRSGHSRWTPTLLSAGWSTRYCIITVSRCSQISPSTKPLSPPLVPVQQVVQILFITILYLGIRQAVFSQWFFMHWYKCIVSPLHVDSHFWRIHVLVLACLPSYIDHFFLCNNKLWLNFFFCTASSCHCRFYFGNSWTIDKLTLIWIAIPTEWSTQESCHKYAEMKGDGSSHSRTVVNNDDASLLVSEPDLRGSGSETTSLPL